MSGTLRLLLAIALVWLAAFAIAGYFMGRAGVEQQAQAEYVSTPATRLERGADIRVEGVIEDGPSVVALWSQKPCLAAVADIGVVGFYRDAQDAFVREEHHAATRRVGPASLSIAVGNERIELPLERWTAKHRSFEETAELPARLGVKPEEIASAKAQLRGDFERFSVAESTIDGGTRVFVVGRLEDHEGTLRIEADRVLGRVELYPGTQDEFVKEVRKSGGGLRTAGWILGAGVGPLPLMIIGLVLLVRRGRRAAG